MSPEALQAVTTALQAQSGLPELRAQFPDCHFTVCSEDDIAPQYRPVSETEHHLVFLVTGQSGHCLSLTNDLDAATGLVLAERSSED